METEGLLLHSQELVTVPRLIADKAIPNPHPIPLRSIVTSPPHPGLGLTRDILPLRFFRLQFFVRFFHFFIRANYSVHLTKLT